MDKVECALTSSKINRASELLNKIKNISKVMDEIEEEKLNGVVIKLTSAENGLGKYSVDTLIGGPEEAWGKLKNEIVTKLNRAREEAELELKDIRF